MAENSWYYEKDGEAIGPFKKELLASFFNNGVITSETLVWNSDGIKQEAGKVFSNTTIKEDGIQPPVNNLHAPPPP